MTLLNYWINVLKSLIVGLLPTRLSSAQTDYNTLCHTFASVQCNYWINV